MSQAAQASLSVFKYSTTHPPFVSLVVLQYKKPSFQNIKVVGTKNFGSASPPLLIFSASGDQLKGDTIIARYLARSEPSMSLYGTDYYGNSDPYLASEIDQWIEHARSLNVETELHALNTELQLRTFFVGHQLSLADIAVWAAIKKHQTLQVPVDLVHLNRWMSYLHSLPEFAAVVQAFLSAPVVTAKDVKDSKDAKSTGKYAPLPDAVEGKVVTRFPPEPSGYLHIGHAKAALMNDYYARHYKGRIIIRFDDTNPSKEKEEYVDNILSDLKRLGVDTATISYTSNFFDQLQKVAEDLLAKGHAYIDDGTKEQIKLERGEGIESKSRNNTLEENLRRWEEMKKGTPEGQKYVFRGKIDMKHPVKCLRDPNLYRVNLTPHHKTGTKYKIYPTYDLACPVVDALEGVTHALRSNEYHDRNHLFEWVLKATGLRNVHIYDFGRLNFSYTVMSKRKLQWFVENGHVQGWNDPSFPTIQGFLRRGLSMEALRNFVYSQGASKTTILMDMASLWSANRIHLEAIVPRYTSIPRERVATLHLTNGPAEPEGRSNLKHKKKPELGQKVTQYYKDVYLEFEDAEKMKENEEVTLMDWGNVIIRKISQPKEGQLHLEGELNPAGKPKDTAKKVTWLSNTNDLVDMEWWEYANLMTKPSLDKKKDSFEQFVNKNLLFKTPAWGDAEIKSLSEGTVFQVERRGLFIIDRAYVSGNTVVAIKIPSGREKGMSTLSFKVDD